MAEPSSTYDVALSFSSADEAVARELDSRLTRHGLTAYTYSEAPGQTSGRPLDAALDAIYSSARSVVFVHSRHWSSPATRVELAAALRGVAGEDGLWVLRLDETPLPPALRDRVWWPAELGLERLAHDLARRLGRSGPTRWQEALIALGVTVLLGVVARLLGFVDPSRGLDRLAWVAVLLPALWGLCFRAWPDGRQHLARRRTREVAVETPLERAWDRWANATRWLALGAVILIAAHVTTARAEAIARVGSMGSAHDRIGTRYGALRLRLNEASTTVASMGAGVLAAGDAAFEAGMAPVEAGVQALRQAVDEALVLMAADAAGAVAAKLDAIVRTLSVNIGHQVDVLVDPDSAPSRRRIATTMLNEYNSLLGGIMLELEEAVRALQAELDRERAALLDDWHGLVR